MKIRVGFSKPKKWAPFAWLIMKGYNVPYSHVYIRLNSSKYDRDLIYQASSVMVNFMGPELFASHNDIVAEFELEVSNENYIAMMQFAIDNAGRPYGMKMALGLAIVRIAELFGKTINNPFGDGDSTYVCCELIGRMLNSFVGANVASNQDNWTPRTIWDYLVLNNNPVK